MQQNPPTNHPEPAQVTAPIEVDGSLVDPVVERLDRLEQALEEVNRTVAGLPDKLHKQPVKVIDLDMPFGAMVGFMVKVAVASVPAGIIALFVFAVFWFLLGGAVLSVLRAMFG